MLVMAWLVLQVRATPLPTNCRGRRAVGVMCECVRGLGVEVAGVVNGMAWLGGVAEPWEFKWPSCECACVCFVCVCVCFVCVCIIACGGLMLYLAVLTADGV